MSLFVTASPNLAPGAAYQSLIVAANGLGTIGPDLTSKELAVGSADTLTATPAKGWVFDKWTTSGLADGLVTNSPVLKFTVSANAIITANFIPNPFGPLQGVYNGLFYDANSAAANSAGFFTLTLNSSGAFSGRLLIGPGAYSFSSQLYGSGAQTVQAVSGKQSVAVNLQLEMTGATGQLRGDVNGGTWDSPLTASLAPVWTAKNPSPLAGDYTMVIPGTTGIGDSFGVVTVSQSGVLSVAGSLADGTAYSQSAPLSKSGEWPFYAYAVSGKDTIFGWVDVGAGGPAADNVTWIKAPDSGRYYGAGFGSVFQLIGSPYVAPPKNSPALSRDLALTLSGGNLSQDMTSAVTLQKNLSYASGAVTLSITNSTGAFSGKFGPGQTMSGVVLQNQDSARGFFLGTNESGAVLLQGN
jgi:hypothetical protein